MVSVGGESQRKELLGATPRPPRRHGERRGEDDLAVQRDP